MRKTLLSAVALLTTLLAATPLFCQANDDMTSSGFTLSPSGFTLIGEANGPSTKADGGIGNINTLAQSAVSYMMIGLSLLCTVLIVAGGLIMSVAGSDQTQLDKGKSLVKYSLMGLAVALASYLIITTVGWLLVSVS